MSAPDPQHAPLPHVAQIDPLAPPSSAGRYADALVTVIRHSSPPRDMHAEVTRTRHFCLHRYDPRIEIGHWLRPENLDNDLAGILADELFAPGWLSGVEIFERVFAGVVRSIVDDPLHAWASFYDNTLRRIKECWGTTTGEDSADTLSSITGFAPVYRRAMHLVPAGRVLDMGSCFGFLPLLLAERGRNTVTATDIEPGSMRLLRAIAERRRARLDTLVCDAAQVPLPDRSVDTVTAVHLLEHLDAAYGHAVISEALRLARRRVVVAVPFEDEPTAAYGHLRTFTNGELVQLGQATGYEFHVTEYHGGWLVVNTD